MVMDKVTISSNFIGDFKIGDNICYNGAVLCALMEANKSDDLNKLIVVQVGSILESALSQIIYRAQNYNTEGVPGISEADRREITRRIVDKFNSIIDVMRKHHILDDVGQGINDDLHKLRQYRNKIHIQDGMPDHESTVFTLETCSWALALNKRILEYLSERFPRPKHTNWVQPLEVPC